MKSKVIALVAGVIIGIVSGVAAVVALGLLVGRAAHSPSTCEAAPVAREVVVESTPSSRLVGHWRNVDNGGEVIYSPVDQLGTATYRLCKPSGGTGPAFRFKVISEDTSGTELVMRDFQETHPAIQELSTRVGLPFSKSDILCSISKDGRQMTQEYLFNGNRSFSVYQRVD